MDQRIILEMCIRDRRSEPHRKQTDHFVAFYRLCSSFVVDHQETTVDYRCPSGEVANCRRIQLRDVHVHGSRSGLPE